MNWLKTMVDIELSAEELAERLTHGGIEVGGVEYLAAGFERVVIGQVKHIELHPNADRLFVCEVDVGHETLTIVTGAQNVLQGDKVPVATDGAVLPNGIKIKPAKLRGILSEGMLCSREELLLDNTVGIERSEGGILILDEDAPVGKKLSEYLGLEDYVLELELYPNRPDCLAMVNVAREVASLLGKEVNLPRWAYLSQDLGFPAADELKIFIKAPELSWRYAGLLVDDIKIEPSPMWMQQRLRAAGVRPINNIVDITNYCMLEMGQPLHAFDRDKITGNVYVRRAEDGEKLVTLDGNERVLDSDMLVIADDRGALAVAGVMGGLESEVTEATQRVLFESAHFLSSSVRRTSRKLGLRSESSNRFEKGVNPYGILPTLGRVCELLEELKCGRPVGLVVETANMPELPTVKLSPGKVNSVLGVEFSKQEIEEVLQNLKFNYTEENGVFAVQIPSHRLDIHIEEDLIEEVARLRGYDKIPTTLPGGAQTQGRRTPEQEFRRRLRHALINAGLDEVVTYSFTRQDRDIQWGSAEHSIRILNPLREELAVMRTSLVPSLLEVAARNVSRRNTDIAVFEIGSVYLGKEQPLKNLPDEEPRVAALAHGTTKRHWLTPVQPYDFYYLKGILESLAREFRVEFSYRRSADPRLNSLLHPGRSAEVLIGSEVIGFVGELHPSLGKEWDLERAVVFELKLAPLFKAAGGTVIAQSIPRYPAVYRDLAVVVNQEISGRQVMERIRELGGKLLQHVEIFDVYTGKPIPEGRKSLAFSLRYQSPERTLTDEEVNALNSRILEGIEKEFGAEWRK